eukprot:IDg18762t1
MLQSQLYGRALDLFKVIDEELLSSASGVDAIVGAFIAREALAVVQVAKFNSHFGETALSEALLAFLTSCQLASIVRQCEKNQARSFPSSLHTSSANVGYKIPARFFTMGNQKKCHAEMQYCENRPESVMFCATAQLNNSGEVRPRKELNSIVDKVHRRVHGHSNFTDMKARKGALSSYPEISTMSFVSIIVFWMNRVFFINGFKIKILCWSNCESTAMTHAIEVFESTWMSELLVPKVVAFDQAFASELFLSFLDKYGIEKRSISARRHNKNVIELKHRVIRDVYLRLKEDSEDDLTVSKTVLVQQALRITNNLYGNDVASVYKLAKGFTRPIENRDYQSTIPKELVKAHASLNARRKLSLILRSKSVQNDEFKPGSLVQVFLKTGKEKRRKWTGNKAVLVYDKTSETVKVPVANGKKLQAAVEDVRAALSEKCFSNAVHDSIDALDRILDEEISLLSSKSLETDDSTDDKSDKTARSDNEDNPSFDLETEKFHIDYDDGDNEDLQIQNETWKPGNQESVIVSRVELSPGFDLQSIEKEAIDEYYRIFRTKEFLHHHAQGLPLFAMQMLMRKKKSRSRKL